MMELTTQELHIANVNSPCASTVNRKVALKMNYIIGQVRQTSQLVSVLCDRIDESIFLVNQIRNTMDSDAMKKK